MLKHSITGLLLIPWHNSVLADCHYVLGANVTIITSTQKTSDGIGAYINGKTCISSSAVVVGKNGEHSSDSSAGSTGKDGGSANSDQTDNYGSISGGKGGAGHSVGFFNKTSTDGGIGGDGVYSVSSLFKNLNTITGGSGGDAGEGQATGGAGGDGFTGNNYTLNNTGNITGGSGGKGSKASSSISTVSGGTGGAGGDGVSGSSFTLNNSGTITGGQGGTGGAALSGGTRGNPGAAGIGVNGRNYTLNNSGTIVGGGAGLFGSDTTGILPVLYGNGNVGLASRGHSVITNNGTISGDSTSDITADAVNLSGGHNQLILGAGYKFIGNVISEGNDTLTLGGDKDAGFDVSQVVNTRPTKYHDTAKYYGFQHYNKTGSSSWTLTGTPSATMNWTLNNGSLQGDSNNFSGNITFSPATDATTGVIFEQSTAGTYAGNISGAGSLTKNGAGQLTLSGTNSYTGGTTINAGALRGSTTSITGNIVNNSQLIFDQDNDETFRGNISGTGSLTKNGTGNLILRGTETYSGLTYVNAGTLTFIDRGDNSLNGLNFTHDIINTAAIYYRGLNLTQNSSITGSGSLTLADGTQMTLATDLNQGDITVQHGSSLLLNSGITMTASKVTNNAGTLTLDQGSTLSGDVDNQSNGLLTVTSYKALQATLLGSLTNSGELRLNPTTHSAGNIFTVNNDYLGIAGSKISIGTVLGDDTSATDKLVIKGNSSGTSAVYITNENGAGAKTTQGIQIIKIDGTSAADFTLGSRVVAGAYDYQLVKGNASGSESKGWYLSSIESKATEPEPTPTPTPTPTPDPTAEPSAQPDNGNIDNTSIALFRPEIGAYAGNFAAANNMFILSQRDRSGETRYLNPLTGKQQTSSVWMINQGGHISMSMTDKENSTESNRYVLQLGGTLLQGHFSDQDQWLLGIMGGYANYQSNTTNSLTGNSARGSLNGYNTGLYASWFQDAITKRGAYLDSWLQYNWFNNTINGQDLPVEYFHTRGLQASLETGYTWRVHSWLSAKGMENSFYLEPHAQVIWSGLKASDHTEQNGTRVQAIGNDNITTRLGLRAYLNGKSYLDKDNERQFQPYLEVNWVNNSRKYGVRMNDEVFYSQGMRDLAEIKTGVEGQLSHSLSGVAGVSLRQGSHGYRDGIASLQLNYHF